MAYQELEKLLDLPLGSIAPILALGSDDRYNTRWVQPRNVGLRSRRNGTRMRRVFAPCHGLKEIQLAIGQMVAVSFDPHSIAHAYTRRRGIITNAQTHLGASMMVHIDLVDFFGSIKQSTIVEALRVVLGDLSPKAVAVIADLCCRDGSLPQGSPASPILSNLACHPLDRQLSDLIRRAGCLVGRYSDDIGISTTAAAFPPQIAVMRNGKVELGQPLLSIIHKHGFTINWGKVRLQTKRSGLRATGLVVGNSVTVPREFRDSIRAALHRWAKQGIGEVTRRYHRLHSEQAFVQRIRGSIDFVGQVQGRDSPCYERLFGTFNDLMASDPPEGFE